MNKFYDRLTLILVCSIFSGAHLFAQHTFSIVAVDPATGEVGSAGASCVDNAANFGGVILISGIIPGRGAINGQATVCIPHVNLNNGISQMLFGSSPDEVLDYLYNNDACQFGTNESRQYGIADFDVDGEPRSAAFTGNQALTYAGHRVGDTYAIQGNILLGPEILDSMEARFLNTPGPLAYKLMAAMQGANVPGADSRCLDEGTSSKSAFLRVARPDDSMNDLYLNINVIQTPDGTEPIDTLQARFDVWSDTVAVSTSQVAAAPAVARLYPNPTSGQFNLDWLAPTEATLEANIYDLNGKLFQKQVVNFGVNAFDISSVPASGLFLLEVKTGSGKVVFMDKILVENR